MDVKGSTLSSTLAFAFSITGEPSFQVIPGAMGFVMNVISPKKLKPREGAQCGDSTCEK